MNLLLHRHYRIPTILTFTIWVLVGLFLGIEAFVLVVILTLLEITLSADNAVINSRVLIGLSHFWRQLFITVGIFIAVFVIRFALPIIIVAITAGISSGDVLSLAFYQPELYGQKLEEAAPVINSFGGLFLLMVGVYYFVDASRQQLWLGWPEKILRRIGRVPLSRFGLVLIGAGLIYLGVGETERQEVATAMALAVAIFLFLHSVTVLAGKLNQANRLVEKTGWAAFGAFVYLEFLDASFSLDGVIGAFALTNNIVIIMAGLGIGAVWVRAITLHLVEDKILGKYRYLEAGAHWAIILLGSVMILKLFHIELPEIVIGSIGLVSIGLALRSSGFGIKIKEKKE